MTEKAAQPGFEIISCAHPRYENKPALAADEAVAEIAKLLRPWGGHLDEWAIKTRRTSGLTDFRLAYWTEQGRTSNTMLAWISHGASDQATRTAQLFVSGDPGTGRDSARKPEDLADHVRAHLRDRSTEELWTIVLVEACGARRFVENVEVELKGTKNHEPSRRLLVLGSGAPQATQFLGTFARDLGATLEQVTEDALPLTRLAELLSRFQDAGVDRYAIARLNLADSTLLRVMLTPRTAVWNDYRDLRRALENASVDSDAYQAMIHYTAKGTGADLGEFAWHFVGRRDERTRIFRWLRSTRESDTHHLLVVCGPPGSGKSALLGSVLIDCHPDLAHALQEVIGKRNIEPPGDPLPAFDLVLHLTGATVPTVAAQILAYLKDDEDVSHIMDPVTEAHRLIATGGRRLLLLADALDESEEPVALAHFFDELLRRSRICMIIGTRERTSDSDSDLTALLIKQGTETERTVLWLEPSPDDVAESLAVRIRDHAVRDLVRDAVQGARAGAVGRSYEHQFLWAAMAAEEINVRAGDLRQHSGALDEVLDNDHAELFRRALERLGETAPLTRTALLALALAHGRGLPRQDRIWEETTSALAPRHEPVTLTDINEVLTAAGAYVMLDHEHGQGVYRLVHRVLQEQLLAEADDLESKRLYVFRQLLGHIRPNQPLNPYFRHRLSAHAASAPAEAWTELAGRLDVLDRLDPYAVAGDALRTGPADRLPPPVLGMMTTAYLARQGGEDDRPGLRRLGEEWIAGHSRRPDSAVTGAWSLRWSMLPRRPAHLPVGEVGRSLTGARALALIPRPGGRNLIAAAAGDTTVRIWDPVTGRPAGPTFDLRDVLSAAGNGRGVRSLVALEHHGRQLLAGAPVGGGVVVWDPLTGQLEPTSIHGGGPVDALAAYRADDGSARLAIAWSSGALVWLDPMTGDHARQPRDAHGGRVSAVVVAGPSSDCVVVVVLTQSGRIHVWDTRTGRPWGRGAQLAAAGVDIVLVEAGFDEIILAATDNDGRCHRCRLRRDAADLVVPADCDLLGRSPGTTRTAMLRPADGRHLLATSDEYGEVRLWDLDRPGVAVAGWPAHRDPVDALVANDLDDDSGWALATIGKGSGVVRVWPTAALAGPAAAAGERQVRKAVVAGDQAVLVRRRELTLVNACQGPPLTERLTEVPKDVAALGGPDPRIVLATRDRLGCWLAGDSSTRQSWPHPSPLKHLAALTLGDEDYLFTLDGHGALRRLDLRNGRPEPDPVGTGIIRPTGMVAYHDGDGVVVAVGGDTMVGRWRYRSDGVPGWAPLPPVTSEKLPQALSSLSGSTDDPAVLFVVTNGQIIRADGQDEQRWRTRALTDPRAAAAWRTDTGDVRLAVGDTDGRIQLFDGAKGVPLHIIPTGLGIMSITTAVLDGHRSLIVGAREGAVAIDVDDTVEVRP
jgi:hypothetical protein